MATKFMAGKRIIGNKSDRDGLTDFNDSLESSGDGTNIGITNPSVSFSNDGANIQDGGWIVVNGLKSTFAGTSTVSVSAWIKLVGDNTDNTIIGMWGGGGTDDNVFDLHVNGSSKLELSTRKSSGNEIITGSTTLNQDTLYHVAFTFDGSSTTVKLYVNGSQDGTSTSTGSTLQSGTDSSVNIGVYGDNSSNPLVGFVKQVLVYSDVLSSSEITTLYNSGTPVTSPSTASLVSKYDLTSNANDSQGSNNGTLNPMKLGTGAYKLDNTAEGRVELGSASDWQFLHNTGAKWTIATWFKRPTAFTNMSGCSLSGNLTWLCETTDGNDSGIGIKYDNRNDPDHRLQCEIVNESNSAVCVIQEDNWFPDDDDWHHLAITFDQTLANTNMIAYLDGVQKGTANKSATPSDVDSGDTLTLGGGVDTHARYGNWTLDDFGIWKRVLTATEISDLVSGQTGYLQQAQGNIGFRGNGKLNYKMLRKNSNESISYDIGTNLNATTWTCRLKLKNTSLANTESGANLGFWGISDKDSTVASDGSQDWIGFLSRCSNSEAEYFGHSVNDSTLGEAGTQMGANDIITSNLTTEWGWEIKRTGETTAVVTLYPNWNFTGTPTATVNLTVSSSYSALRYFVIRNFKNSTSKTTNLNGYIEEIKIWNGTNDTTTTPLYTSSFSTTDTSQLVSSLTNKSEGKAYYSMDTAGLSSSPTWTEDMTQNLTSYYDSSEDSNNQWQKFNPSTDRIEFSHQQNGTWSAMTRNIINNTAMNTAFNTDKWTCRFKVYFSELYGNDSRWSEATFTLSSYSRTEVSTTNKYKAVTTGDNAIGFHFYNTTGGAQVRSWRCDNGTQGADSSTQYSVSGDNAEGWYYCEIKRNGSDVTGKVWTGGYEGTLRVNKTWDVGTDWASTTGDPMKYFGVWSSEDQHGNSGYAVAGYIDELKIYNGIAQADCPNDFSSTSDLVAMTNLPTNTIFEQTDDSPTYWWKQSDNTWSLDGTTASILSGFTAIPSGDGQVTESDGTISFTVNASDKSSGVYKELPATAGTSWVLRFKFDITTNNASFSSHCSQTQGIIDSGVTSSAGWEDPPSSSKTMYYKHAWHADAFANYYINGSSDNGHDWSNRATSVDDGSGKTYYVEMKNNNGSMTTTYYSDSTFETSAYTTPAYSVASGANTSSKQYFFFNQQTPSSSVSGSVVGTISEITFYNNRSSVPS